MLNKALFKQTLVSIVALACLGGPALADPPHARVPVRGFGAWHLDCTAAPCTLFTSVAGSDGSEILRLAAIDGPQLRVTTPLPLYLPDGLTLAIGAEPPRPIVWRTCDPTGCEARIPLDDDLEAALKRERAATVTLTLVDGIAVRLGVSLLGYSRATLARNAATRA